MGKEPRKGTPEGDRFDGKVWMGTALVVFSLLLLLDLALVATIAGGVMFAVGAMKYHAGLFRRP